MQYLAHDLLLMEWKTLMCHCSLLIGYFVFFRRNEYVFHVICICVNSTANTAFNYIPVLELTSLTSLPDGRLETQDALNNNVKKNSMLMDLHVP